MSTTMTMTVATWNIRHGGGKRIAGIVEALQRLDADVVVVTEYRDNESGRRLREGLQAVGYHSQIGLPPPARTNGVLLCSRLPVTAWRAVTADMEKPGRIIEAEIGGLRVIGLLLPIQAEKTPYWERLVQHVSTLPADARVVAIGDYNTGRHHEDEAGATFLSAPYFDRMAEAGYVEGWRHLHPQEREFTWCSPAGNGFRLDHAFISPALLPSLAGAGYDHGLRESGLSDHSLMWVRFRG